MAVAKVTSLGHVGIAVTDMDKMLAFYTSVLGLTVTDGDPNLERVAFLSADPSREHHEFVLSRDPERHANAQQISFKVGTLDDLRDLYHAVGNNPDCRDVRVTNHGIALGCYFRDPEGNRVEAYWSTGTDYVQPAVDPIELDQPNESIYRILEAMPPRSSETPHFYGVDKGKRI